MTERPAAPPEGELIKAALAASPLSQREAARQAGISETRWRQIVSGYQAVGGERITFRSPDDTLARMAHVVDLTPEQLEAVGRVKAAEVLRKLQARKREMEAAAPAAGSQARVDERWHMLEALLRQARVGLSASEYGTLVGRINVFFSHSPEWSPPADLPAAEERHPGHPS